MRHTTRTRGRGTRRAILVAIVTASAVASCGGDDDGTAEPATEPAADAAGESTPVADRPDYGLVTADEAARLAAGGVTVIDVRTPEEYAEGHIEGAELIDLSSPTFADRIEALDPSDEYLVYCRSGNRSAQAVAVMQELGFDRVWDLDGGVIAYDAAGLPLVR